MCTAPRRPLRSRLALVCLASACLTALACRERPPNPPPTANVTEVWSFVTFPDEDTAHRARVVFVSTAEIGPTSLKIKALGAEPGDAADAVQVSSRHLRVADTPRWVYQFDLEDLAPAAVYEVALTARGEPTTSPRRFRTLPAAGGLRVGFGGDLFSSATTQQLLAQVAKERADVLVLGGDLAYANGLAANFDKWDRLLALFDRALIRDDGLTVPIIAAIGNHEVEWKLAGPPRRRHAPFFHAFFAGEDDAHATFFARRLSSHTVLLVLDSGHLVTHASQVPFIDEVLTRHAETPLKIATYHVPLWPSHRPLAAELSRKGREAWGPRFDEHRLTVAMENHDHTLKRTKRLRAGRPDEQGTLYLGDGCMGASERTPDASRPYLAKTSSRFHVWIADLAETGASFRALSPSGEVLDRAEVAGRAPAVTAPPASTPRPLPAAGSE